MKIYMVNREYYEDQSILGIYDDKDKAEKIAQQFRILEKYINKDSGYIIKIYEYELNALQKGVAEDILRSLETIKENFGISKRENNNE